MHNILKKQNAFFWLILCLIFVLPAIWTLVHNGFPLTDDGNWMVIRFSAFYEALKNGQFPVRFLGRLNNGYGYPVADFLYPLFMYLGVPIHILGFSFVNTIKLLMILSLLFSSAFTFLWLRKIFDNLSSFVGAIFYTLFPYFLFDIYTRGSVGEVLALAILPFILWQIERNSLLFVSLGIGGLIVAHNTLSLLLIPFLFAYVFLIKKRRGISDLTQFLFGLGIGSFFWIPAVYDLQYTVFSKVKVSNFSVFFIDKNTQLLGLTSLFLILESVFFLIRKREKFFLGIFITFLCLTFFTFSYSEFLWKTVPFTGLIQFPFRIISLLIPLGAFMVSYLLSKETALKKNILVIIYMVLIFISALGFVFPKNIQNQPDSFYSTNQDTTTVKNEYMPKWVESVPKNNIINKVEVLNGKEKITVQALNTNKIIFNVNLSQEGLVQINTVYFPGWVAYVNGVKTEILYNNPSGLIRLKLNKGENNVKVIFTETPIRILSDIITLISLIGVTIFAWKFNKKTL